MFAENIPISKYKEFLEKIIDPKNIEDHGEYKLIFRCPVCGDSKKNLRKKRGFLLLSTEGKSTVGCLNCDYRASFYYFLKENFPNLYSEWIMEVIMNDNSYIKHHEEEIKEVCYVNYDEFFKLNDNLFNDVRKKAIKLINHRRLPKKIAKHFLYAGEGKFANRIIMPYYMRDGNFKYFEARYLDDNAYIERYKFPSAMPQEIYNLCFVDKTKLMFVFEGVFDSLFVKNSIAIGGVSKFSRLLNEIDDKYHENIVVCFDGDKDGIIKAYKCLKKGFRVLVWNEEMMKHSNDGKIDLNKLIIDGYFDDVLDEDGQIPTEEFMKYIYFPNISNIFAFEMYYELKLGIELEPKKEKDDKFIQQRTIKNSKNSGNKRKSGIRKRFHS